MNHRISLLTLGLCFTMSMMADNPTPRHQLIGRLKKLTRRGMMVGHQDDPVYGRTWKWELERSDVKDLTGSYPAVMGFDLGKMELGSELNLDHVPFDRMRQEIIAQHQRGGVVTLSWHPYNPVTGENAWDPSGHAVTAILPGGAKHDKFVGWLTEVARFIKSLKTADGRSVPVIFRPWHEMGGSWFWWGAKSCTPAEYKQLYIMTHDFVEKTGGCDNVVWAYSPNASAPESEAKMMEYYPGDAYVDLIGVDIYDFEHDNAKYMERLNQELTVLKEIGRKRKKLIALTETGAQQLPYAEWFTKVFWKVASRYPIAYTLFWRNAWDNEKELYMSYKGHQTAADFLRFYEEKRTLFVNDISNKK